ncbi:MAG: TauD/TfdA family dioxygenase [Sphingomonadaceae bacterium]
MTVATRVELKAEDIKPDVGTRILNSKEELLSGQISDEIRELLTRRGVLVFPQIDFADEEQVAFTKTLGNFAPEGDHGENVHPITLDVKTNPSSAEYLKGSLYWHLDGVRNTVPILASLLSCRVPSPKGTGNTGVANTYSAYEALPQETKDEIEGMTVIHAPWASMFYYDPEPNIDKLKGFMGAGEAELPLVWKHKDGRKSLVLGCTAHHVVGVDHTKSAQLLHGLRDWATQDRFVYSHEWTAGDMIIWDNTGTLHRAEEYDPTCGRLMVRTKLEGEEAFAFE